LQEKNDKVNPWDKVGNIDQGYLKGPARRQPERQDKQFRKEKEAGDEGGMR
jgi:hypothetical protein